MATIDVPPAWAEVGKVGAAGVAAAGAAARHPSAAVSSSAARIEYWRSIRIRATAGLKSSSKERRRIRYDARKLQDLLGPPQMTAYDTGIGETLSWIASRRSWRLFVAVIAVRRKR